MSKEISFEHKMDRLQEIVSLLEQGTISLADSVKLYKEGLDLTTKCKEELEKAKHEVKILQNGNLEDFESDVDHSFLTEANEESTPF
jgi:exodeoxyribonuclease VII small subunit